MDELLFLKPNLVIEPLIDKWYAWSHIISPATAAMNIKGRHLKIMNSYIREPAIHAAAVLNPSMAGGPFMDYKDSKVEEIKALRESTLVNQKNLLEFADGIYSLVKLLSESATGYSLENLYTKIPEILKGYVELTYDLNNNPSFRFYEKLLYESKFYNRSSQSVALWLTNNDKRPFCLSTPRLYAPDVLHLNIPFDHPGIDLLCQMKRKQGDVAIIGNLLGIKDEDMSFFRTFFTSKPHPVYNDYRGSKVRMRYFGHACILIECNGVSLLVDPLISYYGYESTVEHFSDLDLPDSIDYVLITHNHQDHILFETLLPLRHKIKTIVVPGSSSGALQDPNLRLLFNAVGFHNVVEITDLEEISFKNCKITGVPFTGEHSDLDIKAKICYHILINDFTFLFMADSRVVEPVLYKHVQKLIGNVDVLFLGMECDGAPLSWLYGPLMTTTLQRDKDQSRRLSGSDYQKGISLVDIFKPKEVYVYAMGQEPWVEFISSIKYTNESNPIIQSNLLVEECKQRGIVAERLFGEKELLY
jgi:L-ascorbate metabolism protein UlaG (beta-lactamase superfamily)